MKNGHRHVATLPWQPIFFLKVPPLALLWYIFRKFEKVKIVNIVDRLRTFDSKPTIFSIYYMSNGLTFAILHPPPPPVLGLPCDIIVTVRFTLNSSTRIIEFRGFLSQFATNFHEILHTLFSIHVVTTLKLSRIFDKYFRS